MENLYTKLKTDQSNVRNKLVEHMMKKGYNQKDIVKLIHLSPRTLGKFLNKSHNVRLTELCKITGYLEKEDQRDKTPYTI